MAETIRLAWKAYSVYKVECWQCQAFFFDMRQQWMTKERIQNCFQHVLLHTSLCIYQKCIDDSFFALEDRSIRATMLRDDIQVACLKADCNWAVTNRAFKPFAVVLSECTRYLKAHGPTAESITRSVQGIIGGPANVLVSKPVVEMARRSVPQSTLFATAKVRESKFI